jgi:hypothetical protein
VLRLVDALACAARVQRYVVTDSLYAPIATFNFSAFSLAVSGERHENKKKTAIGICVEHWPLGN